MVRIIFILFCLFSFTGISQLEISLEGSVNNFSTKEKIYGASLYLFQDGRMVKKSVTDVQGGYYISGKINTKAPFDLLISRPGYITKKVFLDFEDLKVQNPDGIMQAMEELVIELFEIRPGVDLSFVKNDYAEKFNWDASRNIAVPEEKYKQDIEEQVLLAYSKAEESNKSESFKQEMNTALVKKQYDKALKFVDSALSYNNTDPYLIDKKSEIEGLIEKRDKEEAEKVEFETLKKQGDLAFSSGDYLGAEGFYVDALAIKDDNTIKYKLKKVEDYKNKLTKTEENKDKILRLRHQADSLRSINKFQEGIAKLREIQFLDPKQRLDIQAEIKEIQKDENNSNYEVKINNYLNDAARMEQSKDSLDASLFYYERAEDAITRLTDENLIRVYSEKVKDGISSIKIKKSNEREAFYGQLEKANENFLKGPDNYDKALKVLDSDLMKEFSNAPEIRELKRKIETMKSFYEYKEVAFLKYNSDRNEAISELKKAITIGRQNVRITPKEEMRQISDSLESWTGKSNFTSNTNSAVNSPTNTAGSVVRSPGELHSGRNIDAFKELDYTIAQNSASSLKGVESLRNEIDYETYYDKVVESVRSEMSSEEIESFVQQLERSAKRDAMENRESQYEQANERQRIEESIAEGNDYARENRAESARSTQNWVDEWGYMIEMELLNQAIRDQNFDEQNQKYQDERDHSVELNEKENKDRQYVSQESITKLNYEQYLLDSLSEMDGENRSVEVESIRSFQPNYTIQPNYLKDEDGNLFPANEVTERIFKIKSPSGLVTSVIVQRVVVDPNGYGVVYEKTTDQSGGSHYTRNSLPITEYIWFNESTGTDVIQD